MRYVKDQREKIGLLGGEMISTGKDKEAEKLMAEAENRKQQKGLQMLRRLKKT